MIGHSRSDSASVTKDVRHFPKTRIVLLSQTLLMFRSSWSLRVNRDASRVGSHLFLGYGGRKKRTYLRRLRNTTGSLKEKSVYVTYSCELSPCVPLDLPSTIMSETRFYEQLHPPSTKFFTFTVIQLRENVLYPPLLLFYCYSGLPPFTVQRWTLFFFFLIVPEIHYRTWCVTCLLVETK